MKGRRSEIHKFSLVELQYMLYYMNTGRLEDVLQREAGIVSGLRRYGGGILNSMRLTFLYNLGITHMICGQTRKAQHFFNRIRQLGVLSDRVDLQGIARMLRMLLLCESESHVTFESYLRNSQRFYKKNHALYALEETVVTWLSEHHRLTDKGERKASFYYLTIKLAPFMIKRTMGAEEILLWAEGHHQGKPMRVLFEERLGKIR